MLPYGGYRMALHFSSLLHIVPLLKNYVTILEHTLCFGNGTNRPSDRNGYGMYSNMVSEVSTRRERTTTVGYPQTTLCCKFLKSVC